MDQNSRFNLLLYDLYISYLFFMLLWTLPYKGRIIIGPRVVTDQHMTDSDHLDHHDHYNHLDHLDYHDHLVSNIG